MKKVYKYKENRKLKTGEIYSFWIVKEIKLPDESDYYVMRDPYGEKHLLPVRFYKQYNIKPLEYYPCRVDKVNCQGRLFFEPIHPLFKVGEDYLFCFKKLDFLINKKGVMTEYFVMKSQTGETAYLQLDPNLKPKHGIFEKYKVIRIKKAMIFIQKS